LYRIENPLGYLCATPYFGLLEELQAIFDRPIDLVMPSAITNPYFRQNIQPSRTLVYAA
jgi:predicted nucleotidyltransferase